MIHHIKIDAPPIIQSQFMTNLGRVNVVTGKNSAGKSTILNQILHNCDTGIEYKNFDEITQFFNSARKYSSPSPYQIDTWVDIFLQRTKGKIIYTSDIDEMRTLLHATKQMTIGNHPLTSEVNEIAQNLVSHSPNRKKVLFLSPKRKLPHKITVEATDTLDPAAQSALSRLFFLKNQTEGSQEKTRYILIFENFKKITGREFDIQLLLNSNPPDIQLLFRRLGGEWINAENDGLGLPEVLSIILYAIDGDYGLLLIEEPENHLHPDYQRKVIAFLQTVINRQFIISTHSPVFLNPTLVDRIFCCNYSDGEIKINDTTSRADVLTNIGVLSVDNLTSDAIIISEGITDHIIIDYIVKNWMHVRDNAWISGVLLGGSSMKYFDPAPFTESRNVFALIDLDPDNSQAQRIFIAACETTGISPRQLSRYSIENYYTVDAIRAVYGDKVPEGLATFNEAEPIWDQLATEAFNAKMWRGRLKSLRDIPKILDKMTVADIEGTDLHDFCIQVRQAI
jgi:hypothetical protein